MDALETQLQKLVPIEQLIWERKRLFAIFNASEIMTQLRKDVVHEQNDAWNILYRAQLHLMNQLSVVKEAA